MKTKLTSRKLWVAIIAASITAAAPFFGVDPELALKLLVSILGGYIGTEGIIDASRAFKSAEKQP